MSVGIIAVIPAIAAGNEEETVHWGACKIVTSTTVKHRRDCNRSKRLASSEVTDVSKGWRITRL